MPEPEFDPRLMTADRLHRLAGKFALGFDMLEDTAFARVRCNACEATVLPLVDTEARPYVWSAGQLLQDVLRHRVMAHDLSLSGKDDHGN